MSAADCGNSGEQKVSPDVVSEIKIESVFCEEHTPLTVGPFPYPQPEHLQICLCEVVEMGSCNMWPLGTSFFHLA
jgi:hypothetical protein